jgi:CheY-like chemotaxis protein
MEIHPENICPDDIFNRLFEAYKSDCSDKNLTLKLNMPEKNDHCVLRTDPELFRKIIQHLLDNALKFTHSGAIVFGYHDLPDRYEFFVTDTGVGIKQENMEMIFKPFSQEDTTETRGHEGSGLGLSIVKGLAGLMGGSIDVKSEKSKGSTFIYTVPKNLAHLPETGSRPEQPKAALSVKKALLIAEDDFTSFKYFSVALAKLSLELFHAVNGQEAVDLCERHPEIGLVLMDLKMPVMDGFEATRIIKQRRPHLPVVAQTAFALSGDEYKAGEAGCDDYISKPFGRKELLEKLEKFGFDVQLK